MLEFDTLAQQIAEEAVAEAKKFNADTTEVALELCSVYFQDYLEVNEWVNAHYDALDLMDEILGEHIFEEGTSLRVIAQAAAERWLEGQVIIELNNLEV